MNTLNRESFLYQLLEPDLPCFQKEVKPSLQEKQFTLYIDEVGNEGTKKNSLTANNRYLSLTGVIIESDYVKEIMYSEIEGLKSIFFGSHPDDPIIFHRKELIKAQGPFDSLRDVQKNVSFYSNLLQLFSKWEYTVITVLIDKKAHQERYSRWSHHPYHYCLKLMLERYVRFLHTNDAFGGVIAESRGKKPDRCLQEEYQEIYQTGTPYISSDEFRVRLTSKNIKCKPKTSNIPGLQLADLLAYPSHLDILYRKGLCKKTNGLNGRVVQVLRKDKYYRSPGGIIDGYGRKFTP